MNRKLKKYLFTLIAALAMHACAGADQPYIVGGNPGGSDGGGSLPPESGGGISNEGCKVTLNSVFTLKVKLNPTDDPENTDATGLLVTDPRELPPIILHFSGNNVTMYGDEFQVAEFKLGTNTVQLRQKAGTKATGTYDEAGNITLNGVVFHMLSPKDTVFPTFTLSTGNIGPIPGTAGDLSDQGSPINTDKQVTLSGGFTVADLINPYNDKSLTVSIAGTLDKIPSPKDCAGGGGGGVGLKVVTKDKAGKEIETSLGEDGTLIMGNVFVPAMGVDHPENSNALAFKKTSVLRIQNNSSSPVTTHFNNTKHFTYSPSDVNIGPDKSQDVQITFSSPAITYTADDPPPTAGISQTTSVGDRSLKVSGILKKAAAEITVDLGDTQTPGVIDMGFNPVKVSGEGANAKLICSKDDQPNIMGRTVKVFNTGIRPLNIKSIPVPVMDDVTDTKVDPYCPSFGPKFNRLGLMAKGAASCETFTSGGHKYIKDNCLIPPSLVQSLEEAKDYISFKVVYVPKNAKSIATDTKDTGKLTLLTDDPAYTLEKPLEVLLQAGLSKDTSDLLALSKVSNGASGSSVIGNKQRVNIDIPAAETKFTQIFAIKNRGSDTLQSVKLALSDNLDKEKFQLCKSTAMQVDDASCAFVNPDIVSQVPPMVTKEGEAYFALRYTKESVDASTKPDKQSLKITYVSSSTPQAVNEFTVGVSGTKGYGRLSGNVQMKVEFLGSYVASTVLKGKSTDSVDFRNPEFNTVKSGSLRLTFTPADDEGNLMHVKIFNEKAWEDPNFRIESIKSAAERRKFIRLPSDKVMACKGDVRKACENPPGEPDKVLKDCIEEDNIESSYKPDHCSFFYYILKNSEAPSGSSEEGTDGIIPGTYDNETGELTLPNVILHVMNPYHGGVFASNGYDATIAGSDQYKTDTILKATFTTSLLGDYKSNGIDYVPAGQNKIPNLSIDGASVSQFDECSADWDPTIDFDKNNPDLSPRPTFTCYLSPRMSPASPAFLRGMPAVPANNGERSIILAMVTRFNDQVKSPEYIPFFMNDSVMWIAFQGRLKQCNDDWSDCPETPMK